MKLSEVIEYINKALNFPSLSLIDIDMYFDMAIAELNTTLHISIPTLKEQYKIYKNELQNKILLRIQNDPQDGINAQISSSYVAGTNIYYNSTEKLFHYFIEGVEKTTSALYGIWIRNGVSETYVTAVYGSNAYWILVDNPDIIDYEISEWLPNEWILLWLIPYICFKYTVRDGGTASTFAEELTQGFQQLQDSYDIQSNIILATVADKLAYKELVKEFLPNLNILVQTRAIYEYSKHSRNINGTYGSVFDRGGFFEDDFSKI